MNFFLLNIVPVAFCLDEVGNVVDLHQLEYQRESNGFFSQNWGRNLIPPRSKIGQMCYTICSRMLSYGGKVVDLTKCIDPLCSLTHWALFKQHLQENFIFTNKANGMRHVIE